MSKNERDFKPVIDIDTEIDLEDFDNITIEELNEIGIKPDYRVIIAGGRDFTSYAFLKSKCDIIFDELEKSYTIIIVSGGAR